MQEQFKNQNIDVYLPLYKKLTRHAGQMREVSAPLFPRYLFVSFNASCDQWRCINSTRGVIGLVNFNHERPVPISQKIIHELRSTEQNGLVSLAALELFKPGQLVRILDGAFAGYVAIYQKMTDQQRVEILIHFLNQDVVMQLPVCAVEKTA